MKFTKTVMPDAVMKQQLGDSIRGIVLRACADMAHKHDIEPVSTITMISEYCMFSVCDLHREHGIEYFQAAVDEKMARNPDEERAARERRFDAFDKLSIDAQMFEAEAEGSA